MRFEVPQFIDVKEKIVGPLTAPQLLFLGGGAGGAYIAIRSLPSILGYGVALLAIGVAVLLAFGQFNGRPFPVMLYAICMHFIRPRKYLWQFTDSNTKRNEKDNHPDTPITHPGSGQSVSEQRLKDISWTLDILDR